LSTSSIKIEAVFDVLKDGCEGETKNEEQIIGLKKGARYKIEITTWPPTLPLLQLLTVD
jgi:hypothetical protein